MKRIANRAAGVECDHVLLNESHVAQAAPARLIAVALGFDVQGETDAKPTAIPKAESRNVLAVDTTTAPKIAAQSTYFVLPFSVTTELVR